MATTAMKAQLNTAARAFGGATLAPAAIVPACHASFANGKGNFGAGQASPHLRP